MTKTQRIFLQAASEDENTESECRMGSQLRQRRAALDMTHDDETLYPEP